MGSPRACTCQPRGLCRPRRAARDRVRPGAPGPPARPGVSHPRGGTATRPPSVPAKAPRVPLGPAWRPRRLRLSPSPRTPAFALRDPRGRRAEALALEAPRPLRASPLSAPGAAVPRGNWGGGARPVQLQKAGYPEKGGLWRGRNPRGSGCLLPVLRGEGAPPHARPGAQPGTRSGAARFPPCSSLTPAAPATPPEAGRLLVEGWTKEVVRADGTSQPVAPHYSAANRVSDTTTKSSLASIDFLKTSSTDGRWEIIVYCAVFLLGVILTNSFRKG